MRFDDFYLKENITLTGYRSKSANPKGKYGTFYSLTTQNRDTNKISIIFNNLLQIDNDKVFPFEGLPSEYLASLWFKNFDFGFESDKLGIESGELMDKMVTQKAIDMGYDGIKFGDLEFVNLKDHPQFKEIKNEI